LPGRTVSHSRSHSSIVWNYCNRNSVVHLAMLIRPLWPAFAIAINRLSRIMRMSSKRRRLLGLPPVKPDLEALSVPPGMTAVHVGVPFQVTTLKEIDELGVSKVFVLANNSSRPLVAAFMALLEEKGLLAAPLNTGVGMGGGEEGLLKACDAAVEARADCVLTVGGGAVHDAGKLVRAWLGAARDDGADGGAARATVLGLRDAARDPAALPPQIACPNSFAMAELTHVAGLTTAAKAKSGAAHPALMPTVVAYDTALSRGLPDWVRFGTALRGLEHAVGAVTHPKADGDVQARALQGLVLVRQGLTAMVDDPESARAQTDCYLGGWMAIRALNAGCYPALAHLIQNHYSARFDVHQGSCSGILCARILHYHREASRLPQERIATALAGEGAPAPRLVRDLVATLPGVAKEHAEVGVTPTMLRDFADFLFDKHGTRLNQLSPAPFGSAQDILDMLTLPLEAL